MLKKYWFVFFLFPLWVGSTVVVKDGNQEVGVLVAHDGKADKEVISEKELKNEVGSYTQVKESELTDAAKNQNKNQNAAVAAAPPSGPWGDPGIVTGMTEREVEQRAVAAKMGIPHKTTEYAAGDTYPMRTWIYEYIAETVPHFYKVSFDADGKVARISSN
jgi:hypothetical protein